MNFIVKSQHTMNSDKIVKEAGGITPQLQRNENQADICQNVLDRIKLISKDTEKKQS